MPIDYTKYPPKWKTEIVPRILNRANNKCEVCGLENKTTVWSAKAYVRHKGRYSFRTIWFSNKADAERCYFACAIKPVHIILTVAHLDHDELNHKVQDDRLKAMCQYCHLNYDAKEKIRRIIEKGGEKK